MTKTHVAISNHNNQRTNLQLLIIFTCFTTALGIIGGIAAPMYPFFVQIRVLGTSCGGTLISSTAIVTSAKCLYIDKDQRWAFPDEVRITKNVPPNTLKRYTCEQYAKHAFYDPVSSYGLNPFDIAVIRLNQCLDLSESSGNEALELCPQYVKYQKGLALGMGLSLTEDGSVVDYEVLIETQMNLYPYPNCFDYFIERGVGIDERNQVCYSGTTGMLQSLLMKNLKYKDYFETKRSTNK